MKKNILEIYKNYLYALKTREEYGNKYGDTKELIKMYEETLEKEGIKIKKLVNKGE